MLESAIQKKITDFLEKEKGYKVLKLIKTNKNGIADLEVHIGNGRGFWIEVKQETGKESKLQEYRRREYTAIGDTWIVVYGWDDFLEKFNKLKL